MRDLNNRDLFSYSSGAWKSKIKASKIWFFLRPFCLCHPRVFSQSCVSSGGFMVGLMVTSSKRAYAIPRSVAPRTPAPVAVHCWPVPPLETLKSSSVSVFVGSLGPFVHKVSLNTLSISGGMGFDSKCDFTPPTIFLGLLCPWTWCISSKSLQRHATTTPVPTFFLGLLCPWTWGISSQSLQHHAATPPA